MTLLGNDDDDEHKMMIQNVDRDLVVGSGIALGEFELFVRFLRLDHAIHSLLNA